MCSLPGYSQDKQGFHGSRIWVLLSLCTYECGLAISSCKWLYSSANILSSLDLLWYVPKCIAHFVTSITRSRGEEPPWQYQSYTLKNTKTLPWSSCDGLVVVVGPEIGCLAGPGVGEHADSEVGFAEGVSTHKGHHLPSGHGKGVSEEPNGGLAVSNRIRVNLLFGCFVSKLCVSLEKENN